MIHEFGRLPVFPSFQSFLLRHYHDQTSVPSSYYMAPYIPKPVAIVLVG